MRYAKLINGKIEWARNPLWIGNTMIANPTEEHYKSMGFLPVVLQEIPQKEGYYYEPYYEENGDVIYQKWNEKVLPLLLNVN